jgi:hypothetical protein
MGGSTFALYHNWSVHTTLFGRCLSSLVLPWHNGQFSNWLTSPPRRFPSQPLILKDQIIFQKTETFLTSSVRLSKIGLEGFRTSFTLTHEWRPISGIALHTTLHAQHEIRKSCEESFKQLEIFFTCQPSPRCSQGQDTFCAVRIELEGEAGFWQRLETDTEFYFSFHIIVQELSYWDKKLLWGIYHVPWKIDREVPSSLRRKVLGLKQWSDETLQWIYHIRWRAWWNTRLHAWLFGWWHNLKAQRLLDPNIKILVGFPFSSLPDSFAACLQS